MNRILPFTLLLVSFLVLPSESRAETCPKPICVVDRWNDADGDFIYDFEEPYSDLNGNGVWDAGEPYTDANGNSQYDPAEFYDPVITGWISPRDTGTELILTLATPPGPITVASFWTVGLPPLGGSEAPNIGESWFRKWMSECSPHDVNPGDSLLLEPGSYASALSEEVTALINSDPGAYWDEASNVVKGSVYSESPRLIVVPFYNPYFPPASGRNNVNVSKVSVLFLESVVEYTRISVRFVSSNPGSTPVLPTTWGKLKDKYPKAKTLGHKSVID
jgi:hypothetical protein